MIRIIKAKYDTSCHWLTNPKTLKSILLESNSPEMFIIFKNKYEEECFDFLTNLEGKKVIVGNEKIFIPNAG